MAIQFNSPLDIAARTLLCDHPIFTADQIADLHTTRDADELAALLIITIPLDEFPFEIDTDQLRLIMVSMILIPIN